MTDHLLVGPFLTRTQAARRAGIGEEELMLRPDVIHIGGRSLPEAYVAFQFDRSGIRRDLGKIVLALRGRYDDIEIADWLVRENPDLHGATPLAWLNHRHGLGRVVDAAADAVGRPAASDPPITVPAAASASASSTTQRVLRQPSEPRPTAYPARSH